MEGKCAVEEILSIGFNRLKVTRVKSCHRAISRIMTYYEILPMQYIDFFLSCKN